MWGFIGAPVQFLKTAPGDFGFGALLYDALERLFNTALGYFSFGVVFYEAPVHKSCKAPVCYSNKTHQEGVYGAHGVRCANVFCAPVLSLVERTSAV